ncbi:lysosomal alpha-mannosidase-like isoform X2 [Lineus longissimus]|uniref:lysosomal alpha-mannosidase-like isoform X2 n=1 Tax=Lineus longissimus TaxID=88925 RepID=UPI002B4D3AA0
METLLCLSLLFATFCGCMGTPWYRYLFEENNKVTSSSSQCGYETCDLGKAGMVNVHLIPHTHDDVGWLKTVDQYYYGSRNNIQDAGVQYILDSVIDQLQKDPKKRFIYVEMAFFYRWWNQQHDLVRHQVKQLVNEGRLEFILGGWCMNDEAATHYNAIIDQHTLGFKFLRDNFGDCARPRVAWQIDPFGHSKEQASLFAQMGYDGLFFARIDYADKAKRIAEKTLEMMWKASNNLGSSGNIFTGAFYGGYGAPGGYCFDEKCQDTPIMDDDRLHDDNVKARVDEFMKAMSDRAKAFATSHVMQTMGDDFNFQNANMNFKNIDKLIRYVNDRQAEGSKLNLLYSTPSCYLYALNKANYTWPSKSDDFFPYASDPHAYWTGYFTSRSSLKGYVRETNNFLQAVKQLDTLSQLGPEHSSNYKLGVLKRAMGVAQHHDAVSGTEKQHVAYDYAERLANGTAESQQVVSHAYQKLMAKGSDVTPDHQFCDLMNISRCAFTESHSQFVLTVYNPIARPVTSWVRLPVVNSAYRVTGPDGKPVVTQMVPVSSRTKAIPERKPSKAQYTLLMNVSLPPLGFSNYFFNYTTSLLFHQNEASRVTRDSTLKKQDDIVIQNQHVSVSINPTTGMIESMTNKDKGITIPLQQSILYYSSFQGNQSAPKWRNSGAYIFRPKEKFPLPTANSVKVTKVEGLHVTEVHQTMNEWATQVIRLYNNAKYVELEWTVGPIPVADKQGKEVVSYFRTGLASNKLFYTDANGREIQLRTRDYRPTWKLNVTEPVSVNYYPVNSRIFLRDEVNKKAQFSILTDRSLGGSSMRDGDLEIMLHRRMLHDDGFGVNEALNEQGCDKKGLIVRGKLYLLLDTIEASGSLHRDMAEKLFMAPTLSFMENSLPYSAWTAKYNVMYSGVKRALPDNVHLLTMEQWTASTFLLRLEHFYEKNEDATLSKAATVSLLGLFAPFEIGSVDELMLGANQRLADSHRLKWNFKDTQNDYKSYVDKSYGAESNHVPSNALDVTLQPMQIRTFQVSLKQ